MKGSLGKCCLEGYIDLSGTSSFVASESSADTQIGTTTVPQKTVPMFSTSDFHFL